VTLEFGLSPDEVLFLSDGSYAVGIVKADRCRHVFIETEREELIQFLTEDDLIAVSCLAGEKGSNREAVQCMLYLVSRGKMPLLILRKGHPATARLPLVIAAGEQIRLSSCITPGTHPEQDILCARGRLDGAVLHGTPGKVTVKGSPPDIIAEWEPRLFSKI